MADTVERFVRVWPVLYALAIAIFAVGAWTALTGARLTNVESEQRLMRDEHRTARDELSQKLGAVREDLAWIKDRLGSRER
jgi:uncharacterized membrane protein YdfJ with MMPL/SSD domain